MKPAKPACAAAPAASLVNGAGIAGQGRPVSGSIGS
jgi:hypothetical protein